MGAQPSGESTGAGGDTRVALIGLDGFPHRHVRPDLTPHLWRLGQTGGRAPDGGRSELPSTTYPGFVTLLTGASPEQHGVRTTFDRPGAVPGWAGERRTLLPTLLDACAAAGIAGRAVMGDHLLYPVLGLPNGDRTWPEGGHVPPDVSRDAHGYPVDEAVWPHQATALADPSLRFVFCHLNEVDTVGHDEGPDSPAALACCTRTDGHVSRLLEALAPTWERSIVIVVSDHDQEPRAREHGLDPMLMPGLADITSDWIGDGGCAWLRLRPGVTVELAAPVLAAAAPILAWRAVDDRVLLLAGPGEVFHDGHVPLLGLHGGPGTLRTVALVGGGHPLVPALAAAIATRPPRLRDWAPTIAGLLGLDLPDASGTDLLA
jgi:arylsulfatase A-like enzyme